MADATVTVEVGFGDDPGTAVGSTTWTDITSYVDEVEIRRGRQRELDGFRAGTCKVRLEDPDGRFNPANTSGAYWPDVKPMKRLRVTAEDPDTSTTYTVFSGFVDRWPQRWLLGTEMPVTIEATDGFKLFAGTGLPDTVFAYEVGQDSPDHWWKLDDSSGTTAVDSGSVASDGTYAGSPSLGESSLVEHSRLTSVGFDGSNDEMVADRLTDMSGDYTVEALLNADTFTYSGSGSSYRFLCRVGRQALLLVDQVGTQGELIFVDRDDGDKVSSVSLSPGTTHHIAVTKSGSTLKVYVDGSDVTDTASLPVVQLLDPGASVYWGRDAFDASGPTTYDLFDGRLAHCAIYSSALSAARIAAHASAVDEPWNGDTSGERIGSVLDLAGWPSADRDVDTGQTTFGDADLNDDGSVLQYLQRCERSESGHLFVTGDGDVRFVGRHALLTETVYGTSQVTLSDAPGAGEYVYSDLAPNYDDDIVNEVTVQRKFGVGQTVEDTSSQTAYLRRSLSQTGLLMDTDAEAKSRAQWLLSRQKDPRVEVARVELEPEFETGLWAHVLGLDLMSRVTVERTPHSGGDTFLQESHIQGIHHRVTSERWTSVWFLSPVDTSDYLLLDDATFGKLDSNALAY